MASFAKPENALKRAEELVNVGQKAAALQVLHDVITSKRHRAWQKTSEKNMIMFVELCVDLRKGVFAKDGLIQYRIVCQQVNVGSLEEVIKYFMQLSTERAEKAKSQAEALEDALDVDDLEADKTPEDFMLGYVSLEKGKERSDKELVTPWFKFLWETYRTVLEILRNNSKLEALYAMTAHRAFQFCKQYKRTTEFRRLCEIIRNHLANLNKYRDQRDRPDLTAPESLQLYLDTRVEQLKVATDLELWQEAFRSVEDIHGLMSMVKKSPKPSLMVIYYAKLTEIFWVSDSHLYHAYSWLKLFTLQKSYNKNLTQKDLQLIASSLLLSALSVSPCDHTYGASHTEIENGKERNLRMAGLIAFVVDPKRESREMLSRASLLSELTSKGVMTCVSPEVKDLYNLLEHEISPLDLGLKVQPLLAKISKIGGKLSSAPSVPEVKISQYIPALERLATLRVIQQVSRVYRSMKIDSLLKMIPFFDLSGLEKIFVEAVKYNFVSVKINHLEGAVFFGDVDIESENICDHLAIFANSLSKARNLIYPPLRRASRLGDSLVGLADIVNKEHRRLLARKSVIERRKEDQERQMLEMERQEESKKLMHQQKTEEAERNRLAQEYRQREEQRIRREIEEKERRETEALLLETEKHAKKKGKRPLLDGDNVSKQTLIELALNEQVRVRQEAEKKLQKLAKSMDYLERARREEEAPLIEQAFQRSLEEGKILHESEQLKEIESSMQRHTGDVQEKNRLSRMLPHKLEFQQRIIDRRTAEYQQLLQEREDRINEAVAKRKLETEKKRKLLFYIKTEEERLARLKEEEEARKREEAERRRKEDAERKAKLDDIAERQKQREREIEEKKERERREALQGRSTEPPPRPTESLPASRPTEPAAATGAPAAAPAAGKYVPKFRRAPDGGQAAPSEPSRPVEPSQRWSRQDEQCPPQSQAGDRWRDDRRPMGSGSSSSLGGSRPSASSSSSSWSSSRQRAS